MDYINGGELFFHIKRGVRLDEDEVRFYAGQVVLALEYLHKHGIIYRDLKPENILLSHTGYLVLTDFGLSKTGLYAQNDRTNTFCGTPEYMAPEVLIGQPYTKSIDWWSLGTLMFELFCGTTPFYSRDVREMYTKILTQQLYIPSELSPACRSIIELFLQRDPIYRLSDPMMIKKHSFFKTIDWIKLLKMELRPPLIPKVSGIADTRFVDPTFLKMPIEEEEEENSFEEISFTQEDSHHPSSSPSKGPAFQNFTYIPTY
jgi:serine/threonine protein kinase